jgi:hypothetical protein
MKNKIAIASAFLAASSFSTAEIVINDFLSFEGFVDMSYSHTDSEFDGTSESDNSFAIDQVEISWLFDFDPVTAQIDLQYEGDDDGFIVEQAFATYHFDNGGAVTAGRYASMLGFEAFEPTGLYQYSFAYDLHDAFGAVNSSDITIIPGYAQGIKYTYETDSTFFGISLQDEVFDYDNGRLGGDEDSSYGVEAAFAFYMDNGLSWFIGGAYEDADQAEGDTWMLNTYVTFETGAWIFAAEMNYGESEAARFALGDNFGSDLEEEVFQALIMANFAYSDVASVTGRISYADHSHDAGFDADFIKYTLAHGYAFTDNLFLVNEISYVDGELDAFGGSADYESLLFATELIFSF